jgi:hypothetical protein
MPILHWGLAGERSKTYSDMIDTYRKTHLAAFKAGEQKLTYPLLLFYFFRISADFSPGVMQIDNATFFILLFQ